MKEVSSFYNYLKGLLNFVQKNKKKFLNSKKKKKLVNFINTSLPKFKKDLSCKEISEFIKCILTYGVTIQFMNFIDEDDTITVDSIGKGIEVNGQYDMYIFPGLLLSFNNIWYRIEDDDMVKEFLKYVNGMYLDFLLIKDVLKKDKNFSTKLKSISVKPDVIDYGSAVKGRGQLAKYIVKDSISKNDSINKLTKKQVKKASSMVLDDTIKNMENKGIKTDEDINLEDLLFGNEISGAVKDTAKTIEKNMANKVYKKTDLANVATSIFDTCNKKEAVANDPYLKNMMAQFAAELKKQANMSQVKNDPAAKMVVDKLLKEYYDPNIKANPEMLKKMMGKRGFKKKRV